MRDEIEAAVEETGWAGESFKRMGKLDSFIKESQRLSPLSVCKSRILCFVEVFSHSTTRHHGVQSY